MFPKKLILRICFTVILIALLWAIHFGWVSFPLISGYDAKQMCSCVFVSERDKTDIDSSELSEYPFNMATTKIDITDSSVTASIWGFATKKAVYRKGVGCTLINNISESELRSQPFTTITPPALNTDTIPWPMGDKIPDKFPAAIDKTKLDNAVAKSFTEPYPGKKQRTRAVIVLYDGQIVAEKYADHFNRNSIFYGWSMAKSFTAALIGILVKQRKLDILKSAPVAEWKDLSDPRHAITIQQLLQQMSGLDFKEDYTQSSDVTNMLYRKDNMAGYVASLPLAHTPGKVFNYSSGNSNILSRIIRHSVNENEYSTFAQRELFYKTGMYHTSFEPDASGTYVGSSYINATARDYARFGLLYYSNGAWNGEQLLPKDWVEQTITSPAANKLKNYGYQFWLNGFDKNDSKKQFPDVPADMFYCDGYAGQDIYIIPSKKLVILRLGLTLDHSFNENSFLKEIIESLRNN